VAGAARGAALRARRGRRVLSDGRHRLVLSLGWTWNSDWVDASLVAVGILLVRWAGVVGRSRALRRELAHPANGAVTAPLARIAREYVGGVASWTNTGLALGIVSVMTTKPALAGALATLVVAVGLGALVAHRLRRIGTRRV
jgi:hypothetical protein